MGWFCNSRIAPLGTVVHESRSQVLALHEGVKAADEDVKRVLVDTGRIVAKAHLATSPSRFVSHDWASGDCGRRFDNKSTQVEQEEFLRSTILEADQEEENEEAGDMNDEELNELIARTEKECVIFREIDITREREIMENWRNAGNRGKPPLPLMQLEECYQTVQELSERAREKERRATNKLLKEAEPETVKPKQWNQKAPANGKRKRGGNKSMSVVSSIADDDHEDHELNSSASLVVVCRRQGEDEEGIRRMLQGSTGLRNRKRCELFRDLPDRSDVDY
ncbi:hypothetical protein JOM56_013061 [Amanita muscaria]